MVAVAVWLCAYLCVQMWSQSVAAEHFYFYLLYSVHSCFLCLAVNDWTRHGPMDPPRKVWNVLHLLVDLLKV